MSIYKTIESLNLTLPPLAAARNVEHIISEIRPLDRECLGDPHPVSKQTEPRLHTSQKRPCDERICDENE